MDLGNWMNKILIGWGVDPKIANTFDEAIIAVLMVFLAIGLNYLCQWILVGGMKYLINEKKSIPSSDTYYSRNFSLSIIANSFCTRKRTIIDFTKSVCHLYYNLPPTRIEWTTAHDHGYI